MDLALTLDDAPALAGADAVLEDANLFLTEQTQYLKREDRELLHSQSLAHRPNP